MRINAFIKANKVTHESKARNYTGTKEVSSIHFFNAEGLEVGYIVPTIYQLTKTVTKVNRVNPIDSLNKQPVGAY